MIDILENKLTERNNQRGNIIFNSLNQHKRSLTKHKDSTTPVADPRVYQLIGKLHTKKTLPKRDVASPASSEATSPVPKTLY